MTPRATTEQRRGDQDGGCVDDRTIARINKYKMRMLRWPNPVEYVNNMYGCHPDDGGSEYFEVIYADEGE